MAALSSPQAPSIPCLVRYRSLQTLDTYGHQAGDECLKKVANALSQMTKRPTDMVARYGGEEFIAVLPDTPADGGRVIAEMMQAALEKLRIPHSTSKSGNYITASFGVATMEEKLFQEEELIQIKQLLFCKFDKSFRGYLLRK